VAKTLDNLGIDLKHLDEILEARKCFDESLKIFRDKLGEDHPNTKGVLNNLNSLDAYQDARCEHMS
jgi:hypothetical protein